MATRYSDSSQHGPQHHPKWVLAFGALGIVFGDIGTSPLYSLRECFGAEHGLPLSPENIIGILSLIFWTLFLVICVKYIWLIMRADNKGEGGILSLMALAIKPNECKGRKRWLLICMGLFGAALLYGDGAITPAISVLSAVEGLSIAAPVFSPYILLITSLIIVALFFFQYMGTGKIGFFFGPVIFVWFFVLGILGIHQIIENPVVLKAFNPIYAVHFFHDNGMLSFLVLGSVFLVVTGGEALYADMGHFGRGPIRIAWYLIVFPALVLNYFGQGALLLSNPLTIANPFYLMAPDWARFSLVILATAATVIASQALISGVFSITRQAVQLGYCPRMSIVHTSSREIGQIYIPFINWTLMIGVLWLVFSFKTSSNLAAAYGIAVTGTMAITSLLAIQVAKRIWNWSNLKVYFVFGSFLLIDTAFFASNLIKIEHGGWVPLAIGVFIYILMSTWQKGRYILAERLKSKSIPVFEFIEKIKTEHPHRVVGHAIYMSSDPLGVPIPLLHNLKHNKVLHEKVALLTFKTKEVPFISRKDRLTIAEFEEGIYQIIAYYGFMEIPKMKHILEGLREKNIHFPIQETTFVLGRETLLVAGTADLPVWREKIFAFMAKNAERPTAFFKIPPNQVIEVGIQVEI